MSTRTELLEASRRASEVLREFDARGRMNEGYTRVDPTLIARGANVTLMYRPLDQLLGGFVRESSPGIIVNVARPRGLVHMTCAHELGHFFMGHESTADFELDYPTTGSLVERQADQFAYSLLVPQWLVARAMKAKRWTRQDLERPWVVYQLSLRLGTSFKAMAWSLERLGQISVHVASAIAATPLKKLKQEALGQYSLEDWNRDVWLLDSSDQDLILEPSLGDGFVVDLPNHTSAGCLWSIDETVSEGFRLEPYVVDATKSPREELAEPIVGGARPTMRYRLSLAGNVGEPEKPNANVLAADVERQRVEMREGMPWEPASDSDKHIGFGTEFELLRAGLSPADKAHRLSHAKGAE